MAKSGKDVFAKQGMPLIMSLPRNDAVLARAACEGGAHALKVHLNVEHAASGTKFGTLSKEKKRITAVLAEALPRGVAVGIMPGADSPAPVEDLLELAGMGVSFYDIYDFHMPADYFTVRALAPMVALGPGFDPASPGSLSALGVGMLEASCMPHEAYGARLTAADIMVYGRIARDFGGRVVVPTQKAIRPGEVEVLYKAGVRGIMIGAIVTGREAATIRKACAAFREAVDAL